MTTAPTTGRPAALPRADHTGVSAAPTVQAMLASAIGILPLAELFTNQGWIVDAVLAIVVVAGPAALLRAQRPAAVWHTWLGLVLLVPWLTLRFASAHAVFGVVPTASTWADVNTLFDTVRETSRNGVAPVHAGAAITFVIALVAGLLAAFVDIVAVVGRRGALGGVPLLVVYTLSGAVPRHPVSWWLFACAGAAFLLLLSLDGDRAVRSWGRVIPGPRGSRGRLSLGVSAPRIAAAALAAAVILPLVIPSRSGNFLANALHDHHGDSGTGSFGAGSGVALDPFAALKGELQRSKPVPLFTVSVDRTDVTPFYLRANVLSVYTGHGWAPGPHEGINEAASGTPAFSADGAPEVDTDTFGARISITGLADNPPVFASPLSVSGLEAGTNWSATDQLLLDRRVTKGQEYDEEVAQPAPTAQQLAHASTGNPDVMRRWLQLTDQIPGYVRNTVTSVVQGARTPYAKARALSDFFTDPVNGFRYSLTATAGDSGSDLVDFLTVKAGYCQQFAAALAVMMRIAGIPARVVLGYTHGDVGSSGSFTVTTTNAHAWVEAYFGRLGWIPFDPTPLAAAAGGATQQLPWAPHASASAGNAPSNSVSGSARPAPHDRISSSSAAVAGSSSSTSGHRAPTWPIWLGITVLVLLAIGSLPAAVRWRRRRARLRAARNGDPDALWAELSDTAVDLGYVWSAARSPRQVVGWLDPHVGRGPAGASLRGLAGAVERHRYAGATSAGTVTATRSDASGVTDLRRIESGLRTGRTRWARLRARLLPASLGWHPPTTTRRH